MRLLVVEDDLDAAAAMITGLAEAGHECLSAADGLLLQDHDSIRLTPRGRLLSNEVFQAFLAPSRTT